MTRTHIRTKKCPVCPRRLTLGGLKNHIIGTARNEAWEMMYEGREKTPHVNFYWKHCLVIKGCPASKSLAFTRIIGGKDKGRKK